MYECVYICVYIYICDLTFGQFHFVFKGQPFQRNISNSISLFRTISLNRPHLEKQKKKQKKKKKSRITTFSQL